MRILLLTGLLAIPASAASVPPASTPLFSTSAVSEPVIVVPGLGKPVVNPSPRAALGLCRKTAAQLAADRGRKAGGGDLFHKLAKLPPANGYVAVYRQVNGCEEPIVVKYGIGSR
jgi:hypothetical protein